MSKVSSPLSPVSAQSWPGRIDPTKGLARRALQAYTLPTLECHDSNNKKTLTLHCRHRFREASLCVCLARRVVNSAQPPADTHRNPCLAATIESFA